MTRGYGIGQRRGAVHTSASKPLGRTLSDVRCPTER
jgi:hypothetical protein